MTITALDEHLASQIINYYNGQEILELQNSITRALYMLTADENALFSDYEPLLRFSENISRAISASIVTNKLDLSSASATIRPQQNGI